VRSYSIYKHDTTLKMAFGAIFFSPILIPDPLFQDDLTQYQGSKGHSATSDVLLSVTS
jgi:hypothetical protein